jgi:hypothetical protein
MSPTAVFVIIRMKLFLLLIKEAGWTRISGGFPFLNFMISTHADDSLISILWQG